MEGSSRIQTDPLPSGSEQRRAVDLALVRDAGTELADLLDDLVDVVGMTRVPLEPRDINPALLARELIEAVFEPRAEGRDVTWIVGELPRCHADQTLLRRLIEELLDNALKFTAPHERARIELIWDAGAYAYAVRDDGIGLDGELSGSYALSQCV